MSWAEIKHSINSDLDKPLNELINGSKGLVESDNLYYMILRSSEVVHGEDQIKDIAKDIARIKFNWAGSVKLKFYLYGVKRQTAQSPTWNYSSSSNSMSFMDIYINDVLTTTIEGTDPAEIDEYSLNVNQNDIVKIVLRTTSNVAIYGGKLEQLGIYADLFDISGITII